MTKIIKSDFIKNLKEKFSFTEADSKLIISEVFSFIQKGLTEGKRVYLSGIGSLKAKTIPERNIKIPTLSKVQNFPERKKVKFTNANTIIRKIN